MKYTFAGDCMVQAPFVNDYDGADKVRDFIKQGDFRFFNLETTLNEMGSCPGSQFSGGSYLRADKKCLESTLAFDFNITSFNNNHAFDFTVDGFTSTLKILNDYSIPYSGTGYDLKEASNPTVFSYNNEKSALISVCSTFDNSMIAGEKSPCFKGRPGINGLHIKKKLIVTKEQMNLMKEVAKQTGINASDDLDRKDGYLLPLKDNEFSFGSIMMEEGENPECVLTPDKTDLERIKTSILKAKQTCREVVVSYHTHEQIDPDISIIPKFQEDFCRFCIDCGADIVVCHGPHLLRGIEIYNDRPIFYSIGNFIMQLNSIPEAPADFYNKYSVNPGEGIKRLLDVRSNGGKRGLMYNPVMFEAILPFVNISKGKLVEVKLLPVELGYNSTDNTRGLPRIAENCDFMDRLQELSKKYGTTIKKVNNEYFVSL